jgi:PST family polysaccharide transporter
MKAGSLASLRSRMLNPKLLGSARSATWSLSEKLLRLVIGFIVGIWLARYLGPETYGQFNYALAWVGMFNAIAWLGVGETLLRDFVREKNRTATLLGTALALRLAGSVVAGALAVLSCAAMGPGEPAVLAMVVVFALAVPLAEAPAGVFLWYQSRMELGLPVLLVNLVRIAAAAAKVALIFAAATVVAFAWVSVFEALLISAALFGLYAAQGNRITSWRTSWADARVMLISGLPLTVSALVTSVGARTDQLLLGWLLGFHEVGLYVAATRFSEIWWAIPPIIMNALAPHYIFPPGLGEKLRRNVVFIGALMLLAGGTPCVLLSLAGPALIRLLLGPEFAGAGSVLIVHIWIALFIFLDLPIVHYLLATGRQKVLLGKAASILCLNAALCLVFIPQWGAVGAAMATLVAHALGTTIFYHLLPQTQDVRSLHFDMLKLLVRGPQTVIRHVRAR